MNKMLSGLAMGFLLVAGVVLGGALIASLPSADVYAGAGGSCSGQVGGDNQLSNAISCAQPDGAPEDLFGQAGIFNTIANILIFLVGIIAVIMLIIGGIRYAVSGGDQSAVTSAKNTILYAIVGLIVAFLAFAIVNFVTTQLEDAGAYLYLLR